MSEMSQSHRNRVQYILGRCIPKEENISFLKEYFGKDFTPGRQKVWDKYSEIIEKDIWKSTDFLTMHDS